MYQQEPTKPNAGNAAEVRDVIFSLPFSVSDVPAADCGRTAIEGLTTLIADAVRSDNDQRVADLDLILRLVEKMAEPARN